MHKLSTSSSYISGGISLVKMRLIRYYVVVCVYRDEVLCGYFPGDAADDGSNSNTRSLCMPWRA